MIMHGLHPAIVKSYDAETRYCEIEIEGVTFGGDNYLQAQIAYSLGDKSSDTEIEILENDLVWVQFHGGDYRYPIIVFFRTLNADASVGKRRWHHANIEIEADDKAQIIVGDSTITAEPDKIMLEIGNASIKAENNKITLQVGDSSYVLEPEKITETSTLVEIDAENMNTTGTISADADVIGGANTATPISLTLHPHTGNLGAPTSAPLVTP